MLPDSDREDPAAESRTGSLVVAPKKMSSALGSLVANYGSMSESENDSEPEGEFSTVLNLLQNGMSAIPCASKNCHEPVRSGMWKWQQQE